MSLLKSLLYRITRKAVFTLTQLSGLWVAMGFGKLFPSAWSGVAVEGLTLYRRGGGGVSEK